MITSSQSFVIPGKQLARLTLVSPSNEAAIRRRSTLSANKPAELGEINGMPVMGPLGPPQNSGDSQSSAPNNQAPPVISEEESENIPPQAASKTDVAMPQAEDKQCERRQSDVVMTDSHDEHAPQDPDSIPPEQPAPAPVSPSKEPPPVPPRPIPEADRQRQLLEEVEIGAQQDVTEAINNVLFQSQCAIKPISFFPDGEQLDQVKEYVCPYTERPGTNHDTAYFTDGPSLTFPRRKVPAQRRSGGATSKLTLHLEPVTSMQLWTARSTLRRFSSITRWQNSTVRSANYRQYCKCKYSASSLIR